MKRLVLVIAALLFVAGNAFAFPTVDWSMPVLKGTDPQESDVGLDYNLRALYGVFMGGGLTGDLALRTVVYGTATLDPEDISQATATYQWNFDLDGNGTSDIFAELRKAWVGGVLTPYFSINGIEYASNWQKSGSNMEVLIPSSALGTIDPSKFGVYAYLEGGSTSNDDRMPNSGWTRIVPEPASAMMLGIGLISLAGSMFRRKFR